MELAYSLTVALFLTIVLMPAAMRLAPRLGLIDRPDMVRKQHARVIPRSGGVAMAIGIAVPLGYFTSLHFEDNALLLAALFAGSFIVIVFGFLDDRFDLNYRWKFVGQIFAALLVVSGGFTLRDLPLLPSGSTPAMAGHAISFLFILGVTNAVNLTDGLDGLAGGSSLLTLSAIALIGFLAGDTLSTLIALTVIGGILGFLRFNTHPAQIFMGDTGSQLLGFLSACLAILVLNKTPDTISAALPLLLLGLPILDTITVMAIRISEGRSPFSPDRNHIHHQIIALGFRHNEAVAIIYLLQISLLTFAFFFRHADDWVLLIGYVAFCATLLLTLRSARSRGWQFHASRPADDHVERRNILLRKLGWYYRNSLYVVQGFLAVVMAIPLFLADFAHSAVKAGIATAIVALPLLLSRSLSPWVVRFFMYPANGFIAYLLSTSPTFIVHAPIINAGFVALAVLLGLSIRMTRREQFRLDTQDLLVLLIVIAVPLLPIESVSRHAVGEIVLRLSVLMYSCEFVIGRSQGRHIKPLGFLAGFVLLYSHLPV
jgi:UDP-GlcNAc:undecaprenyl-phosphate GlcNAc-1-phosphate transferase